MEQNLVSSASANHNQRQQRHRQEEEDGTTIGQRRYANVAGEEAKEGLGEADERKASDQQQSSMPFVEINQVKILQEALLEVFGQNELLQSRVRELET